MITAVEADTSSVSVRLDGRIAVITGGGSGIGGAIDLAAWQSTLDVNLTGSFLMAQAVGRVMLAQGSGRIISLASQAASVALPERPKSRSAGSRCPTRSPPPLPTWPATPPP